MILFFYFVFGLSLGAAIGVMLMHGDNVKVRSTQVGNETDPDIETILARLGESEGLLADGFDDALIGTDEKGRAVYDMDKMAYILMDRDGTDYYDAMDYLYFNTFGEDVGPMAPIYVSK